MVLPTPQGALLASARTRGQLSWASVDRALDAIPHSRPGVLGPPQRPPTPWARLESTRRHSTATEGCSAEVSWPRRSQFWESTLLSVCSARPSLAAHRNRAPAVPPLSGRIAEGACPFAQRFLCGCASRVPARALVRPAARRRPAARACSAGARTLAVREPRRRLSLFGACAARRKRVRSV